MSPARKDPAAAGKILTTGVVVSASVLVTGLLAAFSGPASPSPIEPQAPADPAPPAQTSPQVGDPAPAPQEVGDTTTPQDSPVTPTLENAPPASSTAAPAPTQIAPPAPVVIAVPENSAPAPATKRSK